jgi:hypothetical protein
MYRLARVNRYITLEGENMVDSKNDELKAQLQSSFNHFEKCGIVEKHQCGEQAKECEYILTRSAKNRLDTLLRRNKGKRSMACLEFLFEKTMGKKIARTFKAFKFDLAVLHLIACDEGLSEKDVKNPHSSNQ